MEDVLRASSQAIKGDEHIPLALSRDFMAPLTRIVGLDQGSLFARAVTLLAACAVPQLPYLVARAIPRVTTSL
jgi:hypothetical protein